MLNTLFATMAAVAATAPLWGSEFHTPAATPRAHYQIDCRIDPDSGSVSGSEIVTVKNPGPLSMTRLAFDWPQDSGRTLRISVSGKSLHSVRDGDIAFIDLPEPLAAGEKIQLKTEFTGPLHRQEGISLMVGWHPRLWWDIHSIDDYDVKAELPDGYVLGTSGSYDTKRRRWLASGTQSFGIAFGKGLVATEAASGDVFVRVLHSAEGAECARVLLDAAVDAIGFYRSRYGFYPYRSLTIVPGNSRPVGGYPVATSLVAVHGMGQFAQMPLSHWRWITAHEIAHQYWLEYVLPKDPEPLDWLLIGLGIYADREYSRARGIADQHAKFAEKYIAGVREGLDTSVAPPAEQIRYMGFDFNNVVRHGKGFSIISALAAVLGHDMFDRVCLRTLKEYGGRRLGVNEFQSVAELESGQNLEWFFDQWARSNRFASFRIAGQACAKEADKYRCTLRVENQGTISMPIPLVAKFEDGSLQTVLTDRIPAKQAIELHSAAPLREVQLDPDGEIALVVPPPGPRRPVRPMNTASISARLNDLPWANNGCGCAPLELYQSAKTAKLSGDLDWFKLGLTLYDSGYYKEALEAFRNLLQPESGGDGEFGVLVWQGQLLDLLGRRIEAIGSYKKAFAAWRGQPMRHDQYEMVLDQAWVEARLKEPFTRR